MSIWRRLQRCELPNAVRVSEQGLFIWAPRVAIGKESAHLCLRRHQVPVPPKRIGRWKDNPEKDEQQDNRCDRNKAGEQVGFGVVTLRISSARASRERQPAQGTRSRPVSGWAPCTGARWQ